MTKRIPLPCPPLSRRALPRRDLPRRALPRRVLPRPGLPHPGPRCPAFLAAFLAAGAFACQPSLPVPSTGEGGAGSTEAEVRLEPDSPLDEAPRVLRVHVVPPPGASVDPSRLFFVRGHVGPAHVRQVEDEDLSAALTERLLPASAFSRDGTGILAPLLTLEPGATYGVLSGSPPLGVDLHVAEADEAPLLDRVWPPPDTPGTGPFAIFCGAHPLSIASSQIELDPAAIPAAFLLGAAERTGSGCLRLDASPPRLPLSEDAPAALSPPFVATADGAPLRLAPVAIPILGAPPETPDTPLACAAGEVAFGPGCARIEDDRLRVATPEAPLLWAVRTGGGAETIRATAPLEPWTLLGLPPAESVALEVAVVDLAGRVRGAALTVSTAPPMPHVIVSEVLANPIGAEPDQEWVELFNDGLADADLAGFTLADIGGVTELPHAVLPSGAFALVVNEAFVEDDELDPPPAKGTLLLRVPKLGKAGLKNDGEPLKLLDATGAVVSRFPATPKTKPGESLSRVAPSAPDGAPSSFKAGSPTPGAPH